MASIIFENVSKTFLRNGRQMLFRSFLKDLTNGNRVERLVALKDVSFEIKHGESVAFIGRNGAGKSTILNLIAGLLKPDGGRVIVDGNVSALLDLGAGFHPDMTGGENLRINAALLGFSKITINEKFDEIVEFSGLGSFIDQPLRTYSSGMVVRLGFSVAVHLDPSILLIDEVLAVGDAAFQQKSFERILELRKNGSIFVCVAHNPEVLKMLCSRGVWIEQGVVMKSGTIEEASEAYTAAESNVVIIRPDEASQEIL